MVLYYISLFSGLGYIKKNQHRKPNNKNRDHLIGQLDTLAVSLWQISAKFNPPSLPFSCWGIFPAAVGKPRHVDGQLWRCRQVPILLLHHRAGQKHLHFPYILHDLVIFSGKKFLKTYQCWSCFVLPFVVMNQTAVWRLSSFQKRWESFFAKGRFVFSCRIPRGCVFDFPEKATLPSSHSALSWGITQRIADQLSTTTKAPPLQEKFISQCR